MNFNASMKQYINDEISAKTSSLNPHKIIEEVLKDLKKNMGTLAYSIDNEPVAIVHPITGGKAPAAPPITIFCGVLLFNQIV